jgi:ketosteroid isomerase-like protein
MTKPSKAILADIYDAWRAHDLDWLATYLPADFSHTMNIPEDVLPTSGLRQGKGAALSRLGEIFDSFDAQYLEPGEIAVSGSQAIVTVHTRCKHRRSGKWLETRKQHIWRLEDGWPVDLSEVYDLAQFEAFIKDARR